MTGIVVSRVFAMPYALPFARAIATARGRFTHRRGWLVAVEDPPGEQLVPDRDDRDAHRGRRRAASALR